MRTDTGVVTRHPWATRATCANAHPWRPETTRWRVRTDKNENTPTRDCLICKAVSEGKRRARRAAERRYT